MTLSDLQAVFGQAPEFLIRLGTGVLILLAAILISAWLARWAARAARQSKADDSASETLRRLTRWGILIIGAVFAVEQVVPNVTSLLAGLGIAGFTLGFALQDVAKNFVAGVLLLIQKPFEIGDTIQVSGFTGTVVDINLRTTDLREVDGRYVIIPNGDVFVSPIVNLSRAPIRRISIAIGVSYDADPDQVEGIALEAIRPLRGMVEDPAPEVVFEGLGDSAVQATVRFWADMGEISYSEAQTSGLKAVKAAVEGAGIDMPYPTQSILLEDKRAA